MKFPEPATLVTHTGMSIDTDRASEASVDSVVVRAFDETTAEQLASSLTLRDRWSLRRIVSSAGGMVGPAYLVSTAHGEPILVAFRTPGGLKTAENRRSHFGRSMPLIGEREHLLAPVWVATSSAPEGISTALNALAFLDPPATLARSVVLVPESSRRRALSNAALLTALASTGFTPYIHCLSQFTWKRPWRRRIDWIGPPPPARSVIPAADPVGEISVANATSSPAMFPRNGISALPLAIPSQLTQEVTP